MKRSVVAVAAAFSLLAGGCATVPVSWQEQLKTYPLVELGEEPPADGNYVVHLPEGKPVPTKIYLEGDLFRQDTVQEVNATLKRDIYFYKDWMSFDMKNWRKKRQTLDIDFEVEIPGYKNPQPGYLKIQVNERKD